MTHFSSSEAQSPTPWVDQDLPNPYMQDDPEQASWAGVIDYYLHGEDHGRREPSNWIVDAEFGSTILEEFPSERLNALQHRLFLHRAVRYMSSQGVRQFIDVGSGLVDSYSTHRVLEALSQEEGVKSDAHTCYVDNHTTTASRVAVSFDNLPRPRRVAVVEGDVRRPDELLLHIAWEELLDLDAPIGLIVTGTMQQEQPNRRGQEVGPQALKRFSSRMPPGSYLALSHVTNEGYTPSDPAISRMLDSIGEAYNSTSIGRVAWRSRAEIESLADGYLPVGDGWGPAELWGQEYTGAGAPKLAVRPTGSYPLIWAGVGQKA